MKHLMLLAALTWGAQGFAAPDLDTGKLPAEFDSLGPTVQQLIREDGRVVNYIDDGDPSWLPVVLTGGLGTSGRVIRLLDFLESMRDTLQIRVITVERNGFGQTEFNPDLRMGDFAADVEMVLDHLGIDKFAVFGISGGGPYTSKIASRNADRLLSVHLAATAPSLGQPDRCTEDSPTSPYQDILKYPMKYFGFPSSSPMHQVEGFQDSAYDEAARATFIRGQMADGAALAHESSLYCREGSIDTSMVKAPVFVYQGLADAVLAATDPADWKKAYPSAPMTLRQYEGEGHDVQYRHLDQILLDIRGYGDRVLVCNDDVNQIVEEDSVGKDTHLGLCAWKQ